MKFKTWLQYCSYFVLISQVIKAVNTYECPKKCLACRTGDEATSRCIHYCSSSNWCGYTKEYHDVNCTLCKEEYNYSQPASIKIMGYIVESSLAGAIIISIITLLKKLKSVKEPLHTPKSFELEDVYST